MTRLKKIITESLATPLTLPVGRDLVATWKGLGGRKLLQAVLGFGRGLRVAVTSSFGSESAVLLDLVAQVDPATPVIFVNTGRLFPETLAYRDRLTDHFGLSDVRTFMASKEMVSNMDPDETLFETDPDACCQVRKVMPYAQALSDFDVLIGGRKRHHGYFRSEIETVELAGPHVKVNPLAHFSADDIKTAFNDRALPRHPLVAKGYASIGCEPCTHKKSCAAKNIREGRWAGQEKTECGIHLNDNRLFESLGDSNL